MLSWFIVLILNVASGWLHYKDPIWGKFSYVLVGANITASLICIIKLIGA